MVCFHMEMTAQLNYCNLEDKVTGGSGIRILLSPDTVGDLHADPELQDVEHVLYTSCPTLLPQLGRRRRAHRWHICVI